MFLLELLSASARASTLTLLNLSKQSTKLNFGRVSNAILRVPIAIVLLRTRYGGTTSSTATALITAVITNRLSVSYGPLTGGTWTRLPRDL